MITFPNAKINLGLQVINKRPDGFHNIATVFYPIGLNDALEIVHSNVSSGGFNMSGRQISGPPGSNLCLRALKLLMSKNRNPELGNPDNFRIHLHKVIPMGAGLGGGSSDGAFTIMALNRLMGLDLTPAQMMEYARELGNDCPFFIKNEPVIAHGRGDQFEPFQIDLSNVFLIVVMPDIQVSTALAYAMVTPSVPAKPLPQIISQPIETWRDELINDFEEPVFSKFPAIGVIKHRLYQAGAIYASMTGSGAAVFGIFSTKPEITHLFPGSLIWLKKKEPGMKNY